VFTNIVTKCQNFIFGTEPTERFENRRMAMKSEETNRPDFYFWREGKEKT
jgi:hypothetical protein